MSRARQTDRNIERIDRPYGRYRIVAGQWNGVCGGWNEFNAEDEPPELSD